MDSDITFVDGLIAKRKDDAPDFSICKLSIKKSELIPFLASQEGDWVNAEILRSRKGKLYTKLDTWEPDPAKVAKDGVEKARAAIDGPVGADDDIPF